MNLEGVIIVAGVSKGGVTYTEEELRKLANNVTVFYEEDTKKLVYRGPDPNEMGPYITIPLRDFLVTPLPVKL